jgi:hypothetical protein
MATSTWRQSVITANWSQQRVRTAALAISGLLQVGLLALIHDKVNGGDAHTYIKLAGDWSSLDRLLSPDAFEGNFWPAGYSGFLQIFAPFGDNDLLVVRLVQVAMVLSMAVAGGLLARTVSETARTVTVIAIAFSPTLIWGGWALGYEILLGWLLLTSLVLLWGPDRSRSKWLPALAGALAGVALVVQFRAVAAVPVLAYLAWRLGRQATFAFALGVAVPLGAWMLRTYLATGLPVPWSSNGGYNLWDGNGPHATGHNVFPLPPIPPGESGYFSAAVHWILAHPAEFFDLSAKKALFLFYPTQFADISERLPGENWVTVGQWAYSIVVVALLAAFAGALIWRPETPILKLAPVFFLAMIFLFFNIVFIVEARFRIPVEAMLITVCVCTFFALFDRYRREPRVVVVEAEKAG